MEPEYPIAIPEDGEIASLANLHEVTCCMLRFRQRCGNRADKGFAFLNEFGTYHLIPMCDMCLDDGMMTGPERRGFWQKFSARMRGGR